MCLVFRVPPGTDLAGNPRATIVIDRPMEAISKDPTRLAGHLATLLAANPGWTHVGTVDKGALPPSRAKRNGWRWNGTRVVDTPE